MDTQELVNARNNLTNKFANLVYMAFDGKITMDMTDQDHLAIGYIMNAFADTPSFPMQHKKDMRIKTLWLDQMRFRSNYMEMYNNAANVYREIGHVDCDLQMAYLALWCLTWCILRGSQKDDTDERCMFFSYQAREDIYHACDRIIWGGISMHGPEANDYQILGDAIQFYQDAAMFEVQAHIINPLYFQGSFKHHESMDVMEVIEYVDDLDSLP